MNNTVYGALFSVGGFLGLLGLITFIRWVNDARCVGWRLRRFETLRDGNPWQQWFAWRPVRTVGGELVWWDTVYRQIGNSYADMEDWTWYYYGTTFDILKDD